MVKKKKKTGRLKTGKGLTTGGGPCNPPIDAGRGFGFDGTTARNNHGQRGKSTIYFSGL